MQNLIVAIGGTGGTTIRSLKYRLGLFNTNEQVDEIYIDALQKKWIEAGKEGENDNQSENYRTLGNWDVFSYAEYQGGDLVDIGRLLETEAAGKKFTDREIYQRYAYRWFQSHYYTKVGGRAILESVTEGAGRWRQFGRMLVDRNHDVVAKMLQEKIRAMESTFKVFMVFSLAGGTGAGAAFDTAMMLRKIAQKENKHPVIYAFIVMGQAFRLEDPSPTYAALRELSRLSDVDANNHYATTYKASMENATVLTRPLFDSKFIIDFTQRFKGLTDDELRYLGLYPALADMIELLIQPEASNYLYQAAANWPKDVDTAKQVKDKDQFTGGAPAGIAYQMLKKKLHSAEDWFVTYKTQRIFFPKDIYLDISRDKLVIQFIDDLFPRGGGNVLQENYGYDGKEITDTELLKEATNQRCYSILEDWNPGFLASAVGAKSTTRKPFSEPKLNERFEGYPADELVRNLFVSGSSEAEDAITDIDRLSLTDRAGGSTVSKLDDLGTFTMSLEQTREEIHTEIDKKLALTDTYSKNLIRKVMADHALNLLNRPHKKGCLGFAREVFRHLADDYLQDIANRIEERETSIKKREGGLKAQCRELSTRMRTEFKKAKQKQLLVLEDEQLEELKRRKANEKLMESITFAIAEANYWKDLLASWGEELTVNSKGSMRVDASESIERSERVLKELAMSSGISLGLPKHEYDADSQGGSEGKSFDTVHTNMGGFQESVHELLEPQRLIDGWKLNINWHAEIPEKLPSEHVIGQIKPMLSLAAMEQQPDNISDVSGLKESLNEVISREAETKLKGVDLFTYLTEWVPKESGDTDMQVANLVGQFFHGCKHYLEFNENVGLWHSYLAYNQRGRDVGDFVAEMGTYSIGPDESRPTAIPNYGDGNSLVFVHFVIGLTIEDAPSLKVPRQKYLGRLNNAIGDSGREHHLVGGVLSNHIFPEEQAMLRFEIEAVGPQLGGRDFDTQDFIPLELSPLFGDLDRMDLFARLYAVGLIRTDEYRGEDYFYFRRGLEVDPQVSPNDVFILSQSASLVHAARSFVTNEPNIRTEAVFSRLPDMDEMTDCLYRCIDKDYLEKDENFREGIQKSNPEKAMWPEAALMNLLDWTIDDLEKLEGEKLKETFKVPYGVKRESSAKEQLRDVTVLFFKRAVRQAERRREKKRSTRASEGRTFR
ncbi:MAG: tubulin-like doman-containing protein [candidate division Zixibacteria bacterium]|nr:tubulin-like doman-containing protein [candidate division Zixibacteria bacterium]MDH3936502.1 tubulin-like doman-containing protein [candidate division Zixibacteria bacterium]MDH4032624.1 tubulin-like doman-containing protein [candidate division Zixibacteria bacterium]